MTKVFMLSILVLALSSIGGGLANASDLSCGGLARQIDALLKDKAIEEVKEARANSNTRAQISATRQTTLATEINTLVSVMIHKNCPMENIPLAGSPYADAARACRGSWGSDTPECRKENWVPTAAPRN